MAQDTAGKRPPMTRERLKNYERLRQEARWLAGKLKELPRVTDQVKGSLTEFPYTQHTIHISGQDPEQARRWRGRMERAHAEMRQIEGYVAGVEDGILRTAMELRYLRGCTWVQTAMELHGTPDSLRKGIDRLLKKTARGQAGPGPKDFA